MEKYPIEKIRNIGLIGHGGSGKTSLAEALLFVSGASNRLGKVDEGTATLDFDPEEVKRKISISTAIAPVQWQKHKINVVDMPGYFDFVGEVKAGLGVVDSALLVVDAVSGVEVGTELTWRYANDLNLSKVIFINKLDRENASFADTIANLREAFGSVVYPIQLPIGKEASFKGVVDILENKAFYFENGSMTEGEVPADVMDDLSIYRDEIIEAIAEADDELLMKYLEGEALTDQDIRVGLRKAVINGSIAPVYIGAGTKLIGVQSLLDGIMNFLPSPADIEALEGLVPGSDAVQNRKPAANEPFSALVFKTLADPYVGKVTMFRIYSGTLKSDTSVYNASRDKTERIGSLFFLQGKEQVMVEEASAGDIVAVAKLAETMTGDTLTDSAHPLVYKPIEFPKPVFSVAVEPKSKGDEDKIGSGLTRLSEEDPTFIVERRAETKQTVVSGMGELHIDVIANRLKRKFGVDVNLTEPRLAYRETIRGKAHVEGKHKKQSGGRGQYGHVVIEMEAMTDGQDFEFVDKIFGGSVPRQYIPAVEKGVREVMVDGVLAGYPVTGVRVTLLDGSFHPVDSSEMAFKIAASLAFKKGFMEARPILLEPVVNVEVLVPEVFMGDVIGDLNKKRGRILGMEPDGTMQVVKAQVPESEMAKYAIDLRSMTQGRGTYTLAFSHYEEVPAQLAESIIEEAKKEEEN